MQDIILNFHISPEEYVKCYTGAARTVHTHSIDGRRVRFPADILKPFVTREGVSGRFQISFDDQGKFHSIKRLV